VSGEVGTHTGEAEPRSIAGGLGATRWRDRARAAARSHPSLATLVALLGLAAISILLRALLVSQVHGPKVFMDELGYERMSQSFAQTGHFSLFGKGGLAYSPLYPLVLSPIYALTSSAHTAYEWAKAENAVLLSLSVFPIYLIARTVLSRGRAIGVAALSLVAPLMIYSSFEMSEALAYPLCLAAIWAMLHAVRRPSLRNDALLLATIVLASAARLQLVVLLPAALTAVILIALLHPVESSRSRALLRAISEHLLLFGTVGVALVAVLVRTAMNGGNLPLAGRYANVGGAHASPQRVLELFFEHLGELDYAVGVIPFAAALLAGYVLVRLGFPRRALMFASVALATTFWVLLEVALDAAAFDSTSNRPRSGFVDLPRIHERYLIYVMPFFFVVLVAALPLLRQKAVRRTHLAFAAVAALLPALIPFGTVINNTIGIDSFALHAFGRATKSGGIVPIAHATSLILVLSALLAAVYLVAAWWPAPPLAVVLTVTALLWASTLELKSQTGSFPLRKVGLPAHADWVDRVVGAHGEVSLVGGGRAAPVALRETAFWNESIQRVYYTCEPAFGSDFGDSQVPAGGVATRYAVVPAAFASSGRVLARDAAGKIVLLAVPGGQLHIPHPPCRG